MEVEIRHHPPLRRGILLQRLKRNAVAVELQSGEKITARCPNSGSLRSCCELGREVALSHRSEGRGPGYSWEMIRMDQGWVGINEGVPSLLVPMALQYGLIPELIGFPKAVKEPASRTSGISFLLEGAPGLCYLDVKSVSFAEGGSALYPDSASPKAIAQLDKLIDFQKKGYRAVALFLVQRPDGAVFRPADHIDPAYGEALRRVSSAGVEILCYRASVSPERIGWGDLVPKDLSAS